MDYERARTLIERGEFRLYGHAVKIARKEGIPLSDLSLARQKGLVAVVGRELFIYERGLTGLNPELKRPIYAIE